ncbi:MAG TPA: ABC transporter substrate-binding protein [bacterium]|nr:ABC transporter substrate-binding protein [bacterium]
MAGGCSWGERLRLVCALIVAAVICGPAGATAVDAQGGVLRVARGGQGRSLDPHIRARFDDRIVIATIYEPLIDSDKDGRLVPVLATSWDIGSTGKVITFHLRRGVTFQDGTPFDASVVRWNIERVLDPATGSDHRQKFEGIIQGVQVVDAATVRIYLTRPYPALFSDLTERPGQMVSPAAVKKYGRDFALHPTGTGPFKFVEWIPGSRVAVERNNAYWNRGAIKSDGITFFDIPERAASVARLRSGELDLIASTGSGDLITGGPEVLTVQGQRGLKAMPSRSYQWESLQMRVDRPPYDNRSLRQAIAYAINRDQILKTIYRGLGIPAAKYSLEGWWADPAYRGITYNPALAAAKLRESGYLGSPAQLTLSMQASDAQVGELIQAQLQAIGLKVRIQLASETDFYPQQEQGLIPFSGPTRWTPRVDPHGLANILFHSTKGNSNTTHYHNPQVDALLDEASSINDMSKRAALYRQIERLVMDDAPYVIYYASPGYALMKENVQGYQWGFDMVPRVARVWLQP